MATGNSNFSTLLTTTLQNFGTKIFDNVSSNIPLLYLLKQKGNIKVVSGGERFNHPLIYGTNASFAMRSSLESVTQVSTDNHTRAVYDIKIADGMIALETLHLAMNAGNKEKLLDYADVKRQEAEISMSELLGSQVWSAGTGKNFGGLQYLIASVPTAQSDVGGISSSVNSYWCNDVYATTVSAFNTSSAGLTAMSTTLNNCTKGLQRPRVILTTKTIWQLYELGLTSNIRYARTDIGDAGFQALQFATVPILADDNCPTQKMYFVDTDSLWLQVLAQGNMQLTGFQLKEDQLASVALMYIFANLTTGSRRTQGLIKTISG